MVEREEKLIFKYPLHNQCIQYAEPLNFTVAKMYKRGVYVYYMQEKRKVRRKESKIILFTE